MLKNQKMLKKTNGKILKRKHGYVKNRVIFSGVNKQTLKNLETVNSYVLEMPGNMGDIIR